MNIKAITSTSRRPPKSAYIGTVALHRYACEAFSRSCALVGLLLLLPLFLTIAVAIKIESRGPVLFHQKRFGKDKRVFTMHKFRSMHSGTCRRNLKQAKKNDPRVTRVGRFLRKTSLDELPQLWNVVKGDMRLVGPRPHALKHDRHFSKHIPNYWTRLKVKPGITGLAQIRGHRGETPDVETMAIRVDYDIEYTRIQSFWIDLRIILMTALIVLGQDNAY